jgi:hypothetical protein
MKIVSVGKIQRLKAACPANISVLKKTATEWKMSLSFYRFGITTTVNTQKAAFLFIKISNILESFARFMRNTEQ